MIEKFREIIYPPKPIRAKGYVGGGMTERKWFPVYRFNIKNGYKQTSVDYGRGYLQALADVKRLNKEDNPELIK